MKATVPLSLKVSLWLLANLALLAGAGVGLYVTQFGSGWNSLTRGALGERLQGIADSIASDLNVEPEGVRPAILATRAKKYGTDFYLFRNDGTQVVGAKIELPEAVRTELNRGLLRGESGPPGMGSRPGRPRPGRGEGGPPDGRPPFDEHPPPEERGFPGGRPPPGNRPPGEGRMAEGRFVFHTADPATTWIGLRVPIPSDFGRPIAGTVVIRATSVLAIGRLLHAGPWLAIAAGAILLSLLFWLPLVGSITRALARLNRATERIAEGQFDTRVDLQRRDELGHLGTSVNRMAERLDTLVNGQKRFLGDVAHELGSPLGRLQVATEILETRADPSLREQVADVREEVHHMAALVNELLAFTKAGLRPRDAELATVPLAALVQDMLDREHAAARVTVTIPADLSVRADAALLSRALGNLVRNALRYTGASDAIGVTAQRGPSGVTVSVDDEGPGVPPEALARLGEPFYRPEIARTRETGGAGLGLAIVRSSVAACGGEVHFSNRTPRGFRAELRLTAG
jgi:two-component system sensor histidine kinase CpxA